MLSPLFVQLFGRQVTDRLTRAGLDAPAALIEAGVEGVAAAGGIPPQLARRILALALDETRTGPADRQPEHDSRETDDALPDAAPAPQVVPLADGERALADTLIEAREQEADEMPGADRMSGAPGDPFVDEAGLVAWMGFAFDTDQKHPVSFSVSDDILEPRPARALRRGQPGQEPMPRGRRGDAPPSGGARVTLTGTFWSFGATPGEATEASPAPRDAEEPGATTPRGGPYPGRASDGGDSPRRRRSNGH